MCDCVPIPPTGRLDMLCPSAGRVYVCALTRTKAMCVCVPAHGPICADVCACLYRMCAKDSEAVCLGVFSWLYKWVLVRQG